MPEPGPRVVVTGVGSVSALGIGGGAHVGTTLTGGVAGIRPVRAFATDTAPSHLGGEVGDVGPHLSPEEVRRLPRVSQFAVVACRLAVEDAGLEPGGLPGLGMVLGSHYGDFRSSEAFARGFLARGPLGLSPLIFPHTVMNGMGAQAAIALGARGPLLTLNQASVAGEVAVARGAGLIRSGRASAVLAGGVDELSGILYHELARLRATSPGARRTGPGQPEGCWPFDRRANGTVIGEGATVLLLEEEGRARARGARVYAELAGAAWGNLPSPAHGLPAAGRRDPSVVRRALEAAGVPPSRVGAAYLTGTGDPAVDACEADLVAAAFRGGHGAAPRLTALTPLVGEHAGLGGLRVAGAAVATLAGGRLPGLGDLRAPIRDDLDLAAGPAAAVDVDTVVVHGVARGGTHAALVLRRVA